MDRKVASMDRLRNFEEARQFLQSIGLRVGEDVVREVVTTLQRKSGRSKFSLWAQGESRDGGERHPICGKGTVSKIQKLFKEERLAPYVSFLDAVALESSEVEGQGFTSNGEHVASILSDQAPQRPSGHLNETDRPPAVDRTSEMRAHKDQLRELARQLFEQTRLNLMQVVETEQVNVAALRIYASNPWRLEGLVESIPDPDTNVGGNFGLEIDRGDIPPKVSLVAERHPSFPRLIEHLAGDFPSVAMAFEGWKRELSHAASSALRLWEELRRRPELVNEPWIEPEQLATAKYGLLSHFTQTAVALACASHYPEIDVSHLRDGDFEITAEIQSSTGERYYKLSWKTPARFGLAFGLAIADDAETLKILESYHQNLCQALKENRQVTLLIRALKEAMDYERHLQGALTQVLRAESFPGRCPGCRPYTSET